MKHVLSLALIFIGMFPVAILVTLMAHPLWRVFEEYSGIESFGHSGPAEWCYTVDYLVLCVVACSIYIRLGCRREKRVGR